MAKKSADIRNYANDLLQQALEQLDDVKTAIARSRDKLEADLIRLVRNEFGSSKSSASRPLVW